MGITVTINTTKAEAKLLNASKEMATRMSNELNRFAILAVNDAKVFITPNVGDGFLRNAISFNPSTPDTLRTSVVVAAFYAPYIEFGTGIFAASYVPTLPKEWQAYAKTFFVSGKGRTHQHPFVYPAIQINIEKLKQRLK